MLDKLGIGCARWQTGNKAWVNPEEQKISVTDSENITKCPVQIAIVSTALLQKESKEKDSLTQLTHGTVIVD